jgi:hypothetical protein
MTRAPTLFFAALGVLAACAPRPRAETPAAPTSAPDDGGPVHGLVVLHRSHQPLPGATVVCGDARVVTDAGGRFLLPHVRHVYGIAVIDSKRASVTIYSALSVRNPVLAGGLDDTGSGAGAPNSAMPSASSAELSGTFVGAGDYPSNPPLHVDVWPSPGAAPLSFGVRGEPAGGPEFGPLHVTWNGPDELGAEVFSSRGGPPPSSPVSCARASTSLRAGAAANVTLEFKAAPVVERPPVSLGYPESLAEMPSLRDEYRVGEKTVRAGNAPSFEHAYTTVDLNGCGAELCTTVSTWTPQLHASAQSCRPVTPNAVALTLRPAPTFSAPPSRTLAKVGLEFTWSPLAGAVYELTLADLYYFAAPPAATLIRVITASPDTVWPDLSAYGIASPPAPRVYTATVAAYGEYANLDEMVSASARSARASRQSFWSESSKLALQIQGPVPASLENDLSEAERTSPPRPGAAEELRARIPNARR